MKSVYSDNSVISVSRNPQFTYIEIRLEKNQISKKAHSLLYYKDLFTHKDINTFINGVVWICLNKFLKIQVYKRKEKNMQNYAQINPELSMHVPMGHQNISFVS